ncbi:unnamed protein product [Ectocarpus sp. 6 AP-2014]
MGMASSHTSPPGGGVVDMTSERDDAAIDLTGPETTESPTASGAGTLAAASNRSSTLLEEDSDCSSSDVLCSTQDARFANFTPTRRRNMPPRNPGSANNDSDNSTVAVIEAPPAGESPGGGASSAIDLSFDSEISATDIPVTMDSSPVVGRTVEQVHSGGLASSSNGGDSQAAVSGAAVAGGGSCRETDKTLTASENGGGTGGSDVDSALAPEFGPDCNPELGPESGPDRVPLESSNGSENDARSLPPSIGSRSPPPSTGTAEGEDLPDCSTWKPPGVSPKRAAKAVVNEVGNPSISSRTDAVYSSLTAACAAGSSTPIPGVSDVGVVSAVDGRGDNAVKRIAGAAPSDGTLGVENETRDEATSSPKDLLAAKAGTQIAIDTAHNAAKAPETLSKPSLDSEVNVPEERDKEAAMAAEHVASPAGSSELPTAALGVVSSQSLIFTGPAGDDAAVKVGDATRMDSLKSCPDGVQLAGNGAASTSKGMLCGRLTEAGLGVDASHKRGTATAERADEPRERGKSIEIAKPPSTAATTSVEEGSRETRSMGQEAGAAALPGQFAWEGASDSDKAVVSLSDARTMMRTTRASPLVAAAAAAAATAAAARDAKVSCPATNVGTGLHTVGSPVTTNDTPSPLAVAAVEPAATAATTQQVNGSCAVTTNVGKGPTTVESPATTNYTAATASELKVQNAPSPFAAAPASAKQGQVPSVRQEASVNLHKRPTPATAKTRNGPLDKPCHLYLQVIGPAPTQDKVPPGKMVTLGDRDAKPVDLLTTLSKPGRYTLYVTASNRWNGGGVCKDPSEEPIEIKHFCIPDNLFPAGEARCIGCGEVLPYRLHRRVIKDPLGPGPLELRLIPRSGLSFLADLTVHVSIPILRGKGSRCSACNTTPAENYVALSNEDVSRALALKAVAHGTDPAVLKELMVPAVPPTMTTTTESAEPPDEDAVATATMGSPKSRSYSIHDVLGIHAPSGNHPTPASSIVAAERHVGFAAASPPVPTTAESTSGISQEDVITTSATHVSAANTNMCAKESEAVGYVRQGEGNPGETRTEQASSVEASISPTLDEGELAAREGPSSAAAKAGSVLAAISSSSQHMSLMTPKSPVAPGQEGTSSQRAQAAPGGRAVEVVKTPADGKVDESLSGFKRALILLDRAVKVGAGNSMGEAKRVLWPIAERLQDALTVARKSSSIEPKRWDELQGAYGAIREKLMGSSSRDGDALGRAAAEIGSSDNSAGADSGVAGSEGGGAKERPRQPAQPGALPQPPTGPSVSHSPSGVSELAEGDKPLAVPKGPAIHDREAAPEAVATSPCARQPSSGAAPQLEDDAGRPGQQPEHGDRSPSSPHQQHAGQYSPPQQQNADQQASYLDRRVVAAPAPLPAAAGLTQPVDNHNGSAGANADAVAVPVDAQNELTPANADAVPTAAAAPPLKSASSAAEKDDNQVCPSCGGVGWVNNDRSSCRICLWSKGDVVPKHGACSPVATVTLAAVVPGKRQDEGVAMAKKRDGSSEDGQTAAQASLPAKPALTGVGPPATAALNRKRSRDEAALDASAPPVLSSAGLAAGKGGAENPVPPSPTSNGSGKRNKIADCVSPPNGVVESASGVSQADSDVASLRHPGPEAVAATQEMVQRQEEKVVEAAAVAPAEAERPPPAASAATAAVATAVAPITAVAEKQAAAAPAAAAATAVGSDSQDTTPAGPSVCTGEHSAASMAASDVTHAVATASSAMPSHADPPGHVAVTSTQAMSQLGHSHGIQNMWAHLPVSAATHHLRRPTVVGAVAEATAAAHAYARAQVASFGGWASTHGAGQLACSSAGATASSTSASFTGIPTRAPPACDMSAAVLAFPLAPFHHPGQEPAVPGTCTDATSYEAQIRAVLTPSMWRGSWGGAMSSGSTFQAAQRPAVASGNDGGCNAMLPQQQHVDGAAASRGDAAPSTSANGERLEPSLSSSSENTPSPLAMAGTGPLPQPVSAVVSRNTSAALPSATATAPSTMVPALQSTQPTQHPGRVLSGEKRTPTPPGAHESSSLPGVVAGGPPAPGEQSAQVSTSSPLLPPRGTSGSAVNTCPSSETGAGAGGAALGTLVGGVPEKTGRESCVGGAGGGGAPAKGQPAVGREAVEGEEQKLERAKVAKKLRREALLRRCITSAENLHLEFRSVEAADAMDRGDDELSRLYLTEGDSIIPDNTRWGVRPRGQPLPYDCLFPEDKARGAVRRGTSAGGQRPSRNKKRLKGSSGGSRGGGRRSTAEQAEFAGEWRD